MSETARLWRSLLVPPAAWAVHLQTCYSLHAAACESQSRVMLYLVSAVLLAVVALDGMSARSLWLSMPDPLAGGGAGKPEDVESRHLARARFLALAGFIGACVFALVILGQTIPTVILRPCD